MSEDGKKTPGRRELLNLIPRRDVPPGFFGASDEAHEKDCDQIVSFVADWLITKAGDLRTETEHLLLSGVERWGVTTWKRRLLMK